MSLVGWSLPCFLFAFPLLQQPCLTVSAVPSKGVAPLGSCRGALGGRRLESGLGFWIYPCKGASGKNMRKDEIRVISKDGRLDSGWTATSPYLRLLRWSCLGAITMPSFGEDGGPCRIICLKRHLPAPSSGGALGTAPSRAIASSPSWRFYNCNYLLIDEGRRGSAARGGGALPSATKPQSGPFARMIPLACGGEFHPIPCLKTELTSPLRGDGACRVCGVLLSSFSAVAVKP